MTTTAAAMTFTEDDSVEEVLEHLAAADAASIGRLSGNYAFVAVSVGFWRGAHQIRNADVHLNGDSLNQTDLAGKPYWHLLPKVWKEKFQAIEHQKQEILRTYAVPARRLRGIHIVRAECLDVCCQQLETLRRLLDRTADEFTDELTYGQFIADIEESLGVEAWKEAKKHIPSREFIRKSIHMERPLVIPTGSVPAWATEQPDSYAAELARKSEKELAISSVSTLIREPRARLAEAIQSVIAQLAVTDKDEHVVFQSSGAPLLREVRKMRRNTVATLAREIERFSIYRDVADDALVAQIQRLEEKVAELRLDCNEAAEAKQPLAINSDNSYARKWLDTLLLVHAQLLSPSSILAGLRKMCDRAGVEV